jgi:hypothetical protein
MALTCRVEEPSTASTGDIEPCYSITSLASASKLGSNAIPNAFAALEIDGDLKPHVQ